SRGARDVLGLVAPAPATGRTRHGPVDRHSHARALGRDPEQGALAPVSHLGDAPVRRDAAAPAPEFGRPGRFLCGAAVDAMDLSVALRRARAVAHATPRRGTGHAQYRARARPCDTTGSVLAPL